MPTYDYKCENCNNVFEFFQSMKDDPLTLCPQCGHNTLKKMVSLPAGLIFKGTGFYLTDYAKKNSSVSSNNIENSEVSKPKETKSETKPAAKSGVKENKKGSGKKKDK